MAGIDTPDDCQPSAYHGLASIFGYINSDGQLCRTNCGIAAAATFLTHYGKYEPLPERAHAIMALLERDHPPDNLGGVFGTSRRRVTRICRVHGIRLEEVRGEAELRQRLAEQDPVIVMLGTCGGRLFNRFDLPGGHWMVAYGYDDEHVYLTNWGSMDWADFRDRWGRLVPRLIDMRYKGLAAVDADEDDVPTPGSAS
jgi:hypothetical protein